MYEMMRCTSAAWPSVCFRGFVSHALEDIVSFASVTHVDIPACGHVRPPAPAVVVISEKPELVFGCSKPRVSQLRLLPESWVSAIPQAQP